MPSNIEFSLHSLLKIEILKAHGVNAKDFLLNSLSSVVKEKEVAIP